MHLKALFRTTVLSAAMGGLLLAQGPMGRGAGMHARGGAMGEVMAGYLGLTDAQKTQIKAIHQDARTQAQPIRQQLRQNHQDLRAAIKTGGPVESLAAAQGNLIGQLTAIRAKSQEQVRKVLTAEQLAKLDQLQAKRGNRRFGPKATPPANQQQ
jgi:Spy/CpxP family protein refolding chaperone